MRVTTRIGSLALLALPWRWAPLLQVAATWVGLCLDGLDGVHARRTGQTSKLGSFLDHFCDQIAYLFFFFALAIRFQLTAPVFLFLLMARMTLAAVAFLHQAETGAWELPLTGPSFGYAVYTVFLVLSAFWPGVVLSPAELWPGWAEWLNRFELGQLTWMKLAILSYAGTLPGLFAGYFRSAKSLLSCFIASS